MFACFACTVKNDAIETWRDADGRTRQIRYRRSRNSHRVVADAEGTPFPKVYNFKRVEDARDCWRAIRDELTLRGFSRHRVVRAS